MEADFEWAAVVPELSCLDLTESLAFYVDVLGFRIAYDRPEDGFAYLTLGKVQVMLEQANGHWATGPLERPFGRGINFQIQVKDVRALECRLRARGVELFAPLRQSDYRAGDHVRVQLEFLVQDPDGYLLRFSQPVG